MAYGRPPDSSISRSACSQLFLKPMPNSAGTSRTSAPASRLTRMLPTLSYTGSGQFTQLSWMSTQFRPTRLPDRRDRARGRPAAARRRAGGRSQASGGRRRLITGRKPVCRRVGRVVASPSGQLCDLRRSRTCIRVYGRPDRPYSCRPADGADPVYGVERARSGQSSRRDEPRVRGAARGEPDARTGGRQALTFARAQLPSQPRAGRFADPQPIRDNAPAIDRLAAFTGRPVPWTP